MDGGEAHCRSDQDHGPERTCGVVPEPQAQPGHDGGVRHPIAEIVDGGAQARRPVVQARGLAVDAVEHRRELHQEPADERS
jgi:hypothetical protein